MKLSVVVPIFNKIEIVEQYIKTNIIHCKNPAKWIVIDNNSNTTTKQGINRLKVFGESQGHEFLVVTESENTGVARAWNKGLTMINTPYTCILNNDCVMMPNWDQELISATKSYDFVSPFVLEQMILTTYTYDAFLKSSKNWEYVSKKNRNRFREGLFGGVVIFAETNKFSLVGEFDERFWLSMEEMDFLWRAHTKGMKMAVIGKITAQHRSGSTRETVDFNHKNNQKMFEQKWGWNFENNEVSFKNKLIKSFNKYLLKKYFLLGPLNPFMP